MCRFARVRVGGPAWVGVGGLARVGVWTWLVSVHVGVVSTRLVSKSVRVGVVGVAWRAAWCAAWCAAWRAAWRAAVVGWCRCMTLHYIIY